MKYERLTEKGWKGWYDEELYTSACEPDDSEIHEIYGRLAELEDKIEQGAMIELPCKVGDKVYTNIIGVGLQNEFTVSRVDLLGFSNRTYSWTWHQLGKSVFLTREEAKAKLKGLRE